jgi:thioredoxin-related protein
MRAMLSALAACLLILLAGENSGRAGLEPGTGVAPRVEVLVFEQAECTYCSVFRRDVLPKYRQALGADAAPLRFVDIQARDSKNIALNARIDTLPTAVVMRDGREVDRIVGYWGPNNFFKLLTHILMRME